MQFLYSGVTFGLLHFRTVMWKNVKLNCSFLNMTSARNHVAPFAAVSVSACRPPGCFRASHTAEPEQHNQCHWYPEHCPLLQTQLLLHRWIQDPAGLDKLRQQRWRYDGRRHRLIWSLTLPAIDPLYTNFPSLFIPFISQFSIHIYFPHCTNCLPFLHSLASLPVLCPSFFRPIRLATCPVSLPHTRHCRRSVAESSHPTPWASSPSACLFTAPSPDPPLSHHHPQQPLCSCQPLSCKQWKFDWQHSLPEGYAAGYADNRRLKYLLGRRA